MIKLISFILLSACVKNLTAQDTLKGIVYDAETREALPGVTVFVPGTPHATLTDHRGHFKLSTHGKKDSVQVSLTGYASKKTVYGNPVSIGLSPRVNSMDEIVVSASREAQSRSETPMAIEKITAGTINDTKATLLTEIINKTPGVVMLNLNNEQHGMSIRQPMGTSPYYLYMEDGIPLRTMGVFNHNALIEMNLFAISSIEVLKGPVSSLYGPEAVGGAINFITQAPTAHTTAKAGIQADNYGYRRFQYGTGGRIGKKLGYYAGGYYARQRNGWMEYSDYYKNSVNLRLDYDLSAKTKVIVAAAYNNYYSQTPGSVDSVSFYQRAYESSSRFTYREVISFRARTSVEHKWNNHQNTTLHFFYRNNEINQNPAYGIRWTKGNNVAKGEINSNATTSRGFIVQHAASLPALKTRLIGGLSADHSPVSYHAHQVDLAATLRPSGNSVEHFNLLAERPDVVLSHYNALLLNTAAYAQADIKPIKKMNITLGARYDHMQFSYTNFADVSKGTKTYQQLSPKIGISYQLKRKSGIYANFSRGFSPPSLTTVFSRKPCTNEFYYDLEPATFNSYEAGTWTNLLKNKMQFNLTVYQMHGRNELLNVRQPDNSSQYQSAGKTLHRGIEYSVNYTPVNSLAIRLGGSNALHRYEEFVLSERSTDAIRNVNGKTMPSAPSWITNAEITWKPVFVRGLRFSMEWQHLSPWYENQVNTMKYEKTGAFGIKGISVLNFRTGYSYRNCEFFCNVMNLSNELYAFNATRGNNGGASALYTAAAPRTFVFGLQYNFTHHP